MAYWPPVERPRMQSQMQYQRQMGLNELLLENRIIFLDLPLDPNVTINASTVADVIKIMLYLSRSRRDQDISPVHQLFPAAISDDTVANLEHDAFPQTPRSITASERPAAGR